MKYLVVIAWFSIYSGPGFCQKFPDTNYPRRYFRDPLNIPISLAANFGELRSNHYHMGLDIRTQKHENLPVYAAADGYIARVKIEPWGFGQAIYINHPNGYSTLYAHLNAFFPALADYIKQEQYKSESWPIQVNIPPAMFPVKKGELIAYSGNTGGSEGPHLHFEIRRTADDTNLNPMLFGLPIPDNTRPVIQRLAVYDRNKSIYEQSPQLFPVKKAGDQYGIGMPIVTTSVSKVGFAISAFDTQSGSANPNGIYEAVLYNNNHPVIGFRMDNISYLYTRNINAHIDYKTKANGGPYLQQLFELPAYTHSIYHYFDDNGTVDISDGAIHSIRIEVKDAYGNRAQLNYKIQYRQNVSPDFLYQGKLFYPFMLDGYEGIDCAFYINEKCLYDSVHIQYSRSVSSSPDAVSMLHSIGAVYIPLQEPFLVRIKSAPDLPSAKKGKTVMQWSSGGKTEVQAVEWQGDWASARFGNFGNFQLLVDEEPPVIIAVGIRDSAVLSKASKIEFIIKDNLGAYRNFRALLDGKWLKFTNDKGRAFIYKFDEYCPPGEHDLKISVEDEVGNIATQVFRFTR